MFAAISSRKQWLLFVIRKSSFSVQTFEIVRREVKTAEGGRHGGVGPDMSGAPQDDTFWSEERRRRTRRRMVDGAIFYVRQSFKQLVSNFG